MDRVDIHAELMHQVAAQPDRSGLRVERQPDTPAFEILRRADAGALVDEDVAVPEDARREHRNGDERAVAAAHQADEFGTGKLRRIELLAAHHAVENLSAGGEHDDIEIDAFDLHLA